MALPTLSKSGVTTVVLSRASTFPGTEPLTINQVVGISDSNVIRVFSLGVPKETLEVVFAQLDTADITNIKAFFNDPLVNWGVFSFQYTDEVGTIHTVRFLQPEFAPVAIADNNFNLTLIFTVA